MAEPRWLTHGPLEQDTCVCKQCGSDDVNFFSETHSWCHQCQEYRSVVHESEFDYRSQDARDAVSLKEYRDTLGGGF